MGKFNLKLKFTLLLSMLLSGIITACYALSCPTIKEIEQDNYQAKGWIIYSATGKKADALMEKAFKKMIGIHSFYGAYWNSNFTPNAQCFYANADEVIQTLFVGRNLPMPSGKYWKPFRGNKGIVLCKDSIKNCDYPDKKL